ncbi:MAG: hypothetical protein J6Q54_01350 [Oscillospiraceae bacterium]|nr:hypothetical protein [Oscillospiraceae bacterium]
MKKFVPYEKLSKKERRKQDSARRNTWGALKPVTRKPKNSRAYDRKKLQSSWDMSQGSADFLFAF